MFTLSDTQLRTVEWAQQNEAEFGGGVIGHKPGCGKTFIAVTITERGLLSKRAHECHTKDLYIVPPTLAQQWQAEIAKFSTMGAEVYIKNNEKRLGDLVADKSVHIIIVSYYTLLHCSEDSLLFETSWHRLIADEAHQIRNPDAIISRAVQRLNGKYRWAMSGTAMMNSVLDLFGLCKFLRVKGCETKAQFDIALRRGLIKKIMIQSTEADLIALNLPPLHDKTIYIHMTSDESKTYRRIQSEGRRQTLRDRRPASMLKIITTMRIAASCTPTKILKLSEMVQQILDSDKSTKILIFCSFHDVLFAYEQALQRVGVQTITYTGDIPQAERDMRLVRFKQSKKTYRVLLLGFKCGNAGINLQCAQHVILDAPNWHQSINEQAIARAYRRGQIKPVHVYRLHTKNTIDDRVAHLAKIKQQTIQRALGTSSLQQHQSGGVTRQDMENLLQV